MCRVTNQSTQKIWALIPFFTELWKTDRRPVGSDLGNGLFQFQFAQEEDLLAVLEKRPYHYAKWMVIVQRWEEPTVSRDFPSLIPFWIMVQGIPIHLWAEETIQELDENLGLFEKLEITSTTVKMRVQINGLLPLIKSSVIDYSNGDEVTATFVYEKLERHCSKCHRLDHEIRDCLVAKHQEREAKAQALKEQPILDLNDRVEGNTTRKDASDVFLFSASNSNGERSRRERSYDPRERRYDARHTLEERRRYRSSQDTVSRRQFRDDPREREKSSGSRTSNHREQGYQNREVSSRYHREGYLQSEENNLSPRHRGRTEARRNDHHDPKDNRPSSERALPHRDHQPLVTREALNEALEEVRDTMIQYTQCADPTESAARRERMRKAEEKGQLEETAVRMVQANLSSNDAEGPSKETENSAERIPASLRLGPSVPVEIEKEAAPTKKRLGRPPGKRTIPLSPKLTKGSTSRKRKIQQTKPPMVRRKMITEEAKASRQKTRGRISNSHDAEGSTNTSDNQPLCNTVPAKAKRKTDFRNPSTLGS